MHGPSDMFGDLDQEDVDEFQELQPDDGLPFDPLGKFTRYEVSSFDKDFARELDRDEDYDIIEEAVEPDYDREVE